MDKLDVLDIFTWTLQFWQISQIVTGFRIGIGSQKFFISNRYNTDITALFPFPILTFVLSDKNQVLIVNGINDISSWPYIRANQFGPDMSPALECNDMWTFIIVSYFGNYVIHPFIHHKILHKYKRSLTIY